MNDTKIASKAVHFYHTILTSNTRSMIHDDGEANTACPQSSLGTSSRNDHLVGVSHVRVGGQEGMWPRHGTGMLSYVVVQASCCSHFFL